MKRSFYALFVLLAAISGPLVVAPNAISRQDAVLSTSSESSLPDDQQLNADVEVPRSQQEPNQPQCVFSFDFGQAPEDLIVLPEDFDYEIYGETEYCEIDQFAAKPPSQNNTTVETTPDSFDPEHTALLEYGDSLCLPFAETESSFEPWDGPAIAGVEPEKNAEELECELAVARYRDEQLAFEEITNLQVAYWLANLIEKTTYTLSSVLSETAMTGVEKSVKGVQILVELEGEIAKSALEHLKQSAIVATEGFTAALGDLSQAIDTKRITAIRSNYPMPPYCDCRAILEQDTEPPIEQEPAEIVNEQIAESPAVESGENQVEFEIPSSELLPNSSEVTQNDASGIASPDSSVKTDNVPDVDFRFLQDAVEQAWGVIQENAQTLERWSKEYDFEPLSPARVDGQVDSP
jgi:hypothetical protein